MRTVTTLFLAAFYLTGCATVPKPLDEAPASAAEIVRAVQCELARVFDNSANLPPVLYRATALTQLDLVITDDRAIKPGLALSETVGEIDVSLQPNVTLGDKTIRTQRLEFVTPFAEIAPDGQSRAAIDAMCPPAGSPAAAKGLGLAEWLQETFLALPPDGAISQASSVVFITDFTVSRTAGGGLSFKTSLGTLSFNEAKLSRQYQNKLQIVIDLIEKPKAPKAKAPTPGPSADDVRNMRLLLLE